MPYQPQGNKKLETGTRTGWLFNYHNTSENIESEDGKGEGSSASALQLLFIDFEGETFEATLKYQPFFLVAAAEGHEREVELGITSMFGGKQVASVQQIDKEDLDLINHLSGKLRTYLKLSFDSTQDLTAVRSKLEMALKRNKSASPDSSEFQASSAGFTSAGLYGFDSGARHPQDALAWMSWIQDIREYDVKYGVRVAIDCKVYVGLWYDITISEGFTKVERCDDSKYAPAMPRVCAFDIETTKAPLKFPQPEVDQIYMISYMVDGRGFLIVNRDIVTADIGSFEYTPKPEYEGFFDSFNEPDEYHTLRRFFDEMKRHKPNVYVTYNGDYFDFPFIHARATVHGMDMRREIGFAQGAEGATLNQKIPHLDCFYWVKRDSYLPQGSQGLKAVTKYKLGYDPIEVDPEEMLPLAQTNPQRMASYSVSDAVSTYYLYLKYVHPFIFSLCTIIPMQADEVLRRGSGTLCESLLMVQAQAKNVVFPNKQQQVFEKFYNGHLIDSETYIGGRVEALKSGLYRSNIDMRFEMNPGIFQTLMDKLDDMLRFAIEVEGGEKMENITNYDEVRNEILNKLGALRDRPDRYETPLIYHLDVGAMYPNIILTNRLQPSSMVTPDICAGCCFHSPNNDLKCKRDMSWMWKGEMFTANRHEFTRVKAQLESESFAAAAVVKADIAAVQKKTYGNRKGSVLEGTSFDKPKDDSWKKKKGDDKAGGGGGYRAMNDRMRQEAAQSLLKRSGGSDDEGGSSDDEDGRKQFHKLEENTQFSMLKKRLGEYSRRAYGKIHDTVEILKTNTVCQRENSFYVDTVRLFRDRRYEYKAALKKWKGNLDKATDPNDIKIAKSRCVQMESLQLAHKCILNSFYGYVMRKGSRWGSMEMAGITTYLGAGLIQVARALVQQIGVTLELDTDGIWCCLPKSFPENFNFTTKAGKKVGISYPCVMLNKDVQDIYSNHQYQEFKGIGEYETRSECSIYFEVDGPYLAMILPASREEGKGIKKRYAVFHPDGRLAELKGFELKRRGELMLIKDFQSLVFKKFLDGSTLKEAFDAAAVVANSALDLLYNKGEGYDPEEVIEKLTESSNMTRRLSEYPETQKSLALTTARRIAEFLGPQMVKDKGLACHFVISRLPPGRPVTERPIPLTIFKADASVRIHFLRKWTGDSTLPADCHLKDILDWEYYIGRFNGCVQKIITIPAALQGLPNPVPRVVHPEWLTKKVQQQSSRFRQANLKNMLASKKTTSAPVDLEELAPAAQKPVVVKKAPVKEEHFSDSDDDQGQNEHLNGSDIDEDRNDPDAREAERLREEAETEKKEQLRRIGLQYFTPGNTRPVDQSFFSDPAFPDWHARARTGWLHRAKLRKEILGNDPMATRRPADRAAQVSSAMDALLVDMKSKALAFPWHILEVRQAHDAPNTVIVFAVVDRTLQHYRVTVPRTITVDVAAGTFQDAKLLGGKVLPRHRPPTRLVEMAVGNFTDKTGDEDIEKLRYLNDDVLNLYEGSLTSVERMIFQVGSVATVRSNVHMQHLKERNFRQRDVFQLSEFDAASYQGYLGAQQASLGNSVFVFHVGNESRGVLAALHHDAGKGVVIVIQPAAAPHIAFQWQVMVDEALQLVGLAAGSRTLTPTVTFEPDMAEAWRRISRFVVDLSNGSSSTRPILAVVQSPLSATQLLQHLPHLHTLPVVRTVGDTEDSKLLADAFRWSRLLTRRMLQRFYASQLWADERLQVSRVAGVPLCNLLTDVSVSALDVMFRRQLKKRGLILWDQLSLPTNLEAPEERPRQVVVESGHYAWCVEFSLSQVDVIAVLFSQLIQECDDPSARALADRGVTPHFNIMRDMLSELMGQAIAGKKAAATLLLVSFARWLRDTSSVSYEPRLVEMVSGLVHRALTALLLRITKLGGKVVKATGQSLMIATSKLHLKDAVHFSQFVCSSLKDQPLLSHLHLQPIRFWGPLCVMHHYDLAGWHVEAEDALRMAQLNEEPSPDQLVEYHTFTFWTNFPQKIKELFIARVRMFFTLVHETKQQVLEKIQTDPTVTLATRADRVADQLSSSLHGRIEKEFQPQLLDEVSMIVDQKIQLLETPLANSGGPASLKLGYSSDTTSSAALEYVKSLCYLLELTPGTSAAIRKTKNNCLRVIGVGPFAPSGTFYKNTEVLLGVQVLETRCSFCNEESLIDLLGNFQTADDSEDLRAKAFRCASCSATFARDLVESELIRKLNRLVHTYTEQDYVCAKCHQSSTTLMSESCCGEYIGKHDTAIRKELYALRGVSAAVGFPLLQEAADFAIAACVA
ncbi:DNA polymerase epsilon catalytic subunit, putative [Bodo saltans]|uniref:DNA polymerase epsilon catalytic subunit n=1 Tax=Bodo saltans TaxID=75058 RepID=A0A0S4JPN4_BODSA|nr:DNA polymerase epsilon catalytic subunit, putative [Bodo saltans]|eukprot:CUG92135.1 DNA polymerase epsilon catalytic subunit, putative [Bodo saltans]